MNPKPATSGDNHSLSRIRFWYGLLIVVSAVFVLRLFYLQVLRHDYYNKAALASQLKQYQIPANRGLIEAHDGTGVTPIVLNQTLYTLFADPKYIKNTSSAAVAVEKIIGGKASDYEKAMKQPTRYAILAKKLSESQKQQIEALKMPGLGTQAVPYRTYSQGSLASQLMGFVNDDGTGEYGIEQALNTQLKGTPGQLKAITDVNGVPLAATKDNIETPAKAGDSVVLTIDLAMQAQMEDILAQEYQKTHSKGLSAVIINPNNGQIKAMANYPSYDPAHYSSVTDPKLFQNNTVSEAIEPGSSMKLLTTAASLDQGTITPSTTFYDPAHWVVDGFNITDIEEDGGPRTQSIESTLNLSLNTGATWMLMQMGGGQINTKARTAWYNYMVNHFFLGKASGIEQGYEANGYVPAPKDNGAGIDLTYANTSFGQAVTTTAVQMAGAASSVLNGGTYYRPTLIDQTISSSGNTTTNKPKVVRQNVVSPKVSQDLIPLMEYVLQQHLIAGFSYLNFSAAYSVGGKTGTAQIAKPTGGYYDDKFNGTYIGFVGGDGVQYVIVVFNMQPGVAGYAGSYGGQPVFADLAHMLINNGYVMPKS